MPAGARQLHGPSAPVNHQRDSLNERIREKCLHLLCNPFCTLPLLCAAILKESNDEGPRGTNQCDRFEEVVWRPVSDRWHSILGGRHDEIGFLRRVADARNSAELNGAGGKSYGVFTEHTTVDRLSIGGVSSAGTLRLYNGQQFLGQALNDEMIGLEEVQDCVWNVIYYETLLGCFDEGTRTITGAPSLKKDC